MSAAPREVLGRWYDQGVEQGFAYMVVWCDTYDYEDYPKYHRTRDQAQRDIDNPESMQKVVEVYDLHKSRAAQLASPRVWALRPT